MSDYCNSKQTDRIVIIDESHLSSLVIRDVYKSLLHFLILSDNVDPTLRTPRLGLSLLQNNGVSVVSSILLPFQPLTKTSISKLKSTIYQINSNYRIYSTNSTLQLINQFNELITESVTNQLHSIISSHRDGSIGCEFNLIVMTGRDRLWIEKYSRVHNSLGRIKNILVKKLEVVCLSSLDDCLQETSVVLDQLGTGESASQDFCTSQDRMDTGIDTEVVTQVLSIMTDEVSLQQYFKNWLVVDNSDNVDVILRIGQLTIKCDIRDCMLGTEWLPYQATFGINCTNPQNTFSYKQYNTQLVQTVELDSVCVLKETGVCESVLFGTPKILKPTSYWKLDWEDLEKNQERFHATSLSLSERKQYILVKQSCNVDSKGRRLPTAHFLVLPCNQNIGSLLVKPIVTRELLIENESETVNTQAISHIVLKEACNALESLTVSKEYNPLGYESKLCVCLEQLYDAGRSTGNASRSTVSVRNERGLVGGVPNRKGVSRGRKRVSFIESRESNESQTLPHRNRYQFESNDYNKP